MSMPSVNSSPWLILEHSSSMSAVDFDIAIAIKQVGLSTHIQHKAEEYKRLLLGRPRTQVIRIHPSDHVVLQET